MVPMFFVSVPFTPFTVPPWNHPFRFDVGVSGLDETISDFQDLQGHLVLKSQRPGFVGWWKKGSLWSAISLLGFRCWYHKPYVFFYQKNNGLWLYMGVFKNRGNTPKMDGENNGKPLLNRMMWRKTHYFRKTLFCGFFGCKAIASPCPDVLGSFSNVVINDLRTFLGSFSDWIICPIMAATNCDVTE